MLSLTVNAPNPLSLSSNSASTFFNPLTIHHRQSTLKPLSAKPISAAIIPSSSASYSNSNPPPAQQQQLYQPFRPPPSPLPPKFRSLDTNGRIDVLSNRLGLWFEYAPLIPALIQEGFTPSTVEELTGISGVEQNQLVVGAQVRESLIHSKTDPDVLNFFDSGGAELLYEIRLLSVSQRAEAARYIVENRFDAKGAQDLAKSVKDFVRRKGDRGWENFNYTIPADCLAFMYYRQALENTDTSEKRTVGLQQALETAVSESAKKTILDDLEGRPIDGTDIPGVDKVTVPVVRMKLGEIAESTKVVVLPVCKAEGGDNLVAEAPWEHSCEGDFGVVAADKAWDQWVVLPGWEPVAALKKGGVAVRFSDARVLPWKVKKMYREEPILVVVDREKKEVAADDGFYLVARIESGGDNLKVVKGVVLKELGVNESLGSVLVVVRPPIEDYDDQLDDEDWE